MQTRAEARNKRAFGAVRACFDGLRELRARRVSSDRRRKRLRRRNVSDSDGGSSDDERRGSDGQKRRGDDAILTRRESDPRAVRAGGLASGRDARRRLRDAGANLSESRRADPRRRKRRNPRVQLERVRRGLGSMARQPVASRAVTRAELPDGRRRGRARRRRSSLVCDEVSIRRRRDGSDREF